MSTTTSHAPGEPKASKARVVSVSLDDASAQALHLLSSYLRVSAPELFRQLLWDAYLRHVDEITKTAEELKAKGVAARSGGLETSTVPPTHIEPDSEQE